MRTNDFLIDIKFIAACRSILPGQLLWQSQGQVHMSMFSIPRGRLRASNAGVALVSPKIDLPLRSLVGSLAEPVTGVSGWSKRRISAAFHLSSQVGYLSAHEVT